MSKETRDKTVSNMKDALREIGMDMTNLKWEDLSESEQEEIDKKTDRMQQIIKDLKEKTNDPGWHEELDRIIGISDQIRSTLKQAL